MAMANNMFVIATIHQPNWETFSMFDKLLLLANGRSVYSGPLRELPTFDIFSALTTINRRITVEAMPYFTSLGYPCPKHTNPADHAINIVNTDFASDQVIAANR